MVHERDVCVGRPHTIPTVQPDANLFPFVEFQDPWVGFRYAIRRVMVGDGAEVEVDFESRALQTFTYSTIGCGQSKVKQVL